MIKNVDLWKISFGEINIFNIVPCVDNNVKYLYDYIKIVIFHNDVTDVFRI